MIKFVIGCYVGYLFVMTILVVTYEIVRGYRKHRHQKEWNSQKRKLELEGKTEGEIREAYFEYCKKIIYSNRDSFGWGIPEIGHINQVRRDADGAEALAE